jgi:hypothetical protein
MKQLRSWAACSRSASSIPTQPEARHSERRGNLLTRRAIHPLATIAALVLAGLVTSCAGPAPAATALPTATTEPLPIALVIAHTNDVAGYLEPCG